MRQDFKKLLCETYRYKGYPGEVKGKKKENYKYEKDDWSFPKNEAMSMGRGTKAFGENLTPLIRFLRKSVGRKWNDVYSEIKKTCPSTGAVNAHIYQHLFHYVNVNAKFIDGKYVDERNKEIVDYGGHGYTFYVDINGFLRKARRFDFEKRKAEVRHVKLGKQFFHRNESGVWFEMIMRPYPEDRVVEVVLPDGRIVKKTSPVRVYDPVYKSMNDVFWTNKSERGLFLRRYGQAIYCAELRQINSKKIKNLKLNEQ